LRLRQNAIVRCPDATSSVTSPAVSPCADARARCRRSTSSSPDGSSSGGFHSAKNRSPRGEPSSVTSVTGSPHSADASSPGLPIVAEENTNTGDEP
jgi:hypothetical protein